MALDFKRMLAEARQKAKKEWASPKKSESEKVESVVTNSEWNKSTSQNKMSFQDYLSLSFDLQPRKIKDMHQDRHQVACGLRYIPGFLTVDEEKQLLDGIYDAPEKAWVQISTSKRWFGVSEHRNGDNSPVSGFTRRLQQWGGTPSTEFRPKKLPGWGDRVIDMLMFNEVFSSKTRPNHILLNEYTAYGGIFAHQDGPVYHPRVAIVSLQSTACLDFWRKSPHGAEKAAPTYRACLRPRSLIIFEGAFYTKMWHSIETCRSWTIGEETLNRELLGLRIGEVIPRVGTRVSLTIRHVPPGRTVE